jgi:hypothetical protein
LKEGRSLLNASRLGWTRQEREREREKERERERIREREKGPKWED